MSKLRNFDSAPMVRACNGKKEYTRAQVVASIMCARAIIIHATRVADQRAQCVVTTTTTTLNLMWCMFVLK